MQNKCAQTDGNMKIPVPLWCPTILRQSQKPDRQCADQNTFFEAQTNYFIILARNLLRVKRIFGFFALFRQKYGSPSFPSHRRRRKKAPPAARRAEKGGASRLTRPRSEGRARGARLPKRRKTPPRSYPEAHRCKTRNRSGTSPHRRRRRCRIPSWRGGIARRPE